MRILAYLCFALSAILGAGALMYLQRPSWSPLTSVLGALALPSLFTWWGVICWRRYGSRSISQDQLDISLKATSFKLSTRQTVIFFASIAVGALVFAWFSKPNHISLPSKSNAHGKRADSNAVKPIEVASTCPESARLRTIAEIRLSAPQYSGYNDDELTEALIKLCYPAEQPTQLAERLVIFNSRGKIK